MQSNNVYNPSQANRRFDTIDKLLEPLHYKTSLGGDHYKGKALALTHGIEATTESLIYHVITVLKQQYRIQQYDLENGRQDEIKTPLVDEQNILALIDFLKGMAPHNPYFKSLTLENENLG